jgi:hypothetical protein
LFQRGFTGGAQQAVDQGIVLSGAQRFQPPEGGDDALTGVPFASRKASTSLTYWRGPEVVILTNMSPL